MVTYTLLLLGFRSLQLFLLILLPPSLFLFAAVALGLVFLLLFLLLLLGVFLRLLLHDFESSVEELLLQQSTERELT